MVCPGYGAACTTARMFRTAATCAKLKSSRKSTQKTIMVYKYIIDFPRGVFAMRILQPTTTTTIIQLRPRNAIYRGDVCDEKISFSISTYSQNNIQTTADGIPGDCFIISSYMIAKKKKKTSYILYY